MYRVAVITASDSGYNGMREDKSSLVIYELVVAHGYEVTTYKILPDEQDILATEMRCICDSNDADLLLTTGGTGFSPRDVTPEATLAIVERLCPGIAEAMRMKSLEITPRAMLSRAVAGIRAKTLIINLPGSPKAVRECLEFILPAIDHGLDILTGAADNCARENKTKGENE